MKNCFHVSLVLVLGGLAIVGCSEASDEFTNTIKCGDVCQRYSDCFDADYDVEGCTDRCEDDADASEKRQQRLQSCSSCIDDKSCADAFNCATECAGVI